MCGFTNMYVSNSIDPLDKASPDNWLDDNFWINKAYHEWRALLVNSNWWLASFEGDMTPASAIKGETSNSRVGTTFWQLRRAAWLTWRILDFKAQLDRCAPHCLVFHPLTCLFGFTGKNYNQIPLVQVNKPCHSHPPKGIPVHSHLVL